MRNHLNFLKSFLCVFFAAPIIFVAIIYSVDPLQYFRPLGEKATFLNQDLIGESRRKVPGMIKYADYDSIIVGSCLAQNFSYKKMEKLLGHKVLNAAAPSLTLHEQNHYVNYALKFNKVKNVYWTIESALFGPVSDFSTLEGTFPHFLFTHKISLDLFKHYLFSSTYLRRSLKVIFLGFKKEKPSYIEEDYLETFNRWPSKNFIAPPLTLSENEKKILITNKDNLLNISGLFEKRIFLEPEDLEIDAWKKVYETEVLSVVRKNPDIHFSFFFTPYSALNQSMGAAHLNGIVNQMHMKIWIVKELSSLKNAQVYDFQAIEAVSNLENYSSVFKDAIHYYPRVNDQMISLMAEKKYLVNAETIQKAIVNQLKMISQYTKKTLGDP